MTIDIIEDFRFIVIPYMVNRFKEINYEGQGGSDAKEFMSNFNEICNLAIKALEQEPTTKINLGVDCISRTRAIERLKLNFPISQGTDNSRDRHRYMQALADLQAIKELPPVTPQKPKTGHWTCDRANVRCSCCGKGYKDFYGKARIANYNYCPNCGAKMENEDNNVETI